jgi:ribonuclease P protein component
MARPPNRTRALRVRKRAEFDRIQRGGERVNTRRFVLILARQESGDAACRLGVTASRKIGGAVVRNRAKRLVREAFRTTPELWQSGVDLVVIVKKPLGETRLSEVVEEWRSVAGPLRKRIAGLLAETRAAAKNPA